MNATRPHPPENISTRKGPSAAELRSQLARKLEDVRTRLADRELAAQLAEIQSLVEALQRRLDECLETEVATRTQELSSLTSHLQTHTEREKAALARELHDELGGILTPAKMDLAWLESRLGNDPEYNERMARLGKLIDQGIDLKRRVIEKLRPSLLDHLGLASALQWYVDETCRAAGIEPHLHIGKTLERLPPDLEIALYRLVQEAVTNVVRHSKAGHLDLTLERTPKGIHLTVSDDGVGMENAHAASNLTHGLTGMRHRLRSVGGTLDVHSVSGSGTRVAMFVPLG